MDEEKMLSIEQLLLLENLTYLNDKDPMSTLIVEFKNKK